MKKLNLWLLASFFVAAFTLTACGSDDDSGSPAPTPTSVVGTWDAFIKASNPDDMALRYSHKLTYVFKQDGTFKMRTAYGSGNSSDQFQAEETVDFKGNYVAENGKLVFSNVTYVVTMWDGSKDRGNMGNGTPFNYSLNGNTLTIGSDDPNMVRFGHHHILVGTLTKSSGDIDDSENNPPQVNEETIKGIWDGSLEHDFAQGYYQRWRVQFDGKNYTSWRTHQMVGTASQADLGLQTVGSKSQGTWEYVDGALVLTPEKMWDSYYQTADDYQTMSNLRYVFNSYNTETMEASPWYEFSELIIKSCVENEKKSGNPQTYMYIKYWPVVSLTAKELTVRINMDTFKLTKQ
jgi:hypothetical protein